MLTGNPDVQTSLRRPATLRELTDDLSAARPRHPAFPLAVYGHFFAGIDAAAAQADRCRAGAEAPV